MHGYYLWIGHMNLYASFSGWLIGLAPSYMYMNYAFGIWLWCWYVDIRDGGDMLIISVLMLLCLFISVEVGTVDYPDIGMLKWPGEYSTTLDYLVARGC